VSLRGALVRLHRWAGLAMAAFLTLAGLTGAVIAFQGELDAWLNPSLYRARDPGPALSPDALVARLAQQEPRAELTYLSFRVPPGMSVPAFVRPRAGTTPDLGFDQVFLDPASGTILGTRRWGACCFAADRVVPFLYRFHYTLAAGNTGEIFMGVVAILWALDCFVGLSLTFPRGRPFLLKWRTAWTIKHPAAAQRRVLDLHRAGALWLWLLLLLMGVSGVALALPDQVFRPLLGALTPLTPSPYAQAATRPHPAPDRPRIGFDRAIELAAAVARARGWAARPGAVFDASAAGALVVYFFETPFDRGRGLGTPVVYLDDSSGEVLRVDAPGAGTTGDDVLRLQFPLHSGQVAGTPGRIVVAVLGMTTAMLSVTGVLIWWVKRRAQRRVVRDRRTLVRESRRVVSEG